MQIPKLIKFLWEILIVKPLWWLLKPCGEAVGLVAAAIVIALIFITIFMIVGLAFSTVTFFNWQPSSLDELSRCGGLVIFCSTIFIAIIQGVFNGFKCIKNSIKDSWDDIYE